MREINSFVMYYDWDYLIKGFNFEKKGKLLDCIFHHSRGESIPFEIDEDLKPVFDYICIYLDRDKQKYIDKCLKMEENAKKRYEKQKEKEKNKNSSTSYDIENFEKMLNSDD